MNKTNLMSLSSGILFLIVFSLPANKFGIVLYLLCAIAALAILIYGQKWQITFQNKVFPSFSVFLISLQIALKLIFGLYDYELISTTIVMMIQIMGVIYLYILWRNNHKIWSKKVLLLCIFSYLITGLLVFINHFWPIFMLAIFSTDWVIYSITVIITALIISSKRKMESWLFAFSYIPFLIFEIIPIQGVKPVYYANLDIFWLFNFVIFFVFFILLPVLLNITKENRYSRMIVSIFLFVSVFYSILSRWIILSKTQLPREIFLQVFFSGILVILIPIFVLYKVSNSNRKSLGNNLLWNLI